MPDPQRLSLTIDLPPRHRLRTALEESCQELLDDLGPEWFITINQEKANCTVGIRRHNSGRTCLRDASFTPTEQNPNWIGKWLREAVRQIRQESRIQFGMMPIGDVAEESVTQVLDLVGLYGGRLHPDGWITLPDTRSWQTFLSRAEALGVRLAASVREV